MFVRDFISKHVQNYRQAINSHNNAEDNIQNQGGRNIASLNYYILRRADNINVATLIVSQDLGLNLLS